MPNGVLKDGDVHFAGDQTADNLYGWQEGAALSAFETAQAIRDGRADMDM
jgi:monoamine oxidase